MGRSDIIAVCCLPVSSVSPLLLKPCWRRNCETVGSYHAKTNVDGGWDQERGSLEHTTQGFPATPAVPGSLGTYIYTQADIQDKTRQDKTGRIDRRTDEQTNRREPTLEFSPLRQPTAQNITQPTNNSPEDDFGLTCTYMYMYFPMNPPYRPACR